MRDSFIFYRSFYEAIKELPVENQLNVYSALFEYGLNHEEIELTGIEKAIFSLIKPQLDANQNKYENGCKGGRPKKENQTKTKSKPKENQAETKQEPNVNDNVNDNDNDNDIYNTTSEDKSSSVGTAKASKHRYGKYKNVLLKDEELQTLQKEYSNWNELIQYLDDYIEMKGYKAKSHYLAIKKWVVDAVKEKKSRKTKNINNHAGRTYNDLNKFYDNLGEQNVKSL